MVKVDGAELKVNVQGEGIPVLLIHGSITSSFLDPLADQLLKTKKYRVIRYARRGFQGHKSEPIDMMRMAADAAEVTKDLGVEKAHVVGHSYGALIALQLASKWPEKLSTLTLLEPPLMGFVPSGEQFVTMMGEIGKAYQAGDREGAMTAFLTPINSGGPPKQLFEQTLPPGAWDVALKDLDTLFQVEMPALMQWKFAPEMTAVIKVPVLNAHGDKTIPPFLEVHELLKKWFPNAESAAIPGAHTFPLSNPKDTADTLGKFWASHP